MQWFQLITALLPIAEEIFAAIQGVIAAGQSPAKIHDAIVDHMTELPARIRATP